MNKKQDTPIGTIPSDWDIGSFEDDLEVQGRIGWRGYKTSDLVENGPLVIGGSEINSTIHLNLDNAKKISREKFEESPEIMLNDKDILLVTRGNLGDVGLYKEEYGEATINPSIIILKDFKGHPEFLFYYLISKQGKHNVLSLSSGSSVPAIYQSEVKKLRYPKPSLPEQRAIAGVLSSLDDKIELLHRQNKTLEAMAEALFRQWFVEEAGEECVSLGDYAINIKNNVKVDLIHNYNNYIGLEHIPKKTITITKWGKTKGIESNKSAFIRYDILFGKLRSYFHKVLFAPIDGICSTDILVIRPKKKDWFAFCLFWFSSKEVIDHSDLGSSGTRMPRTNWKVISEYNIPKPNPKMITFFNDLSLPLIEKIMNNIVNIQLLDNLRDQLLPKLIKGDYRISQEDI